MEDEIVNIEKLKEALEKLEKKRMIMDYTEGVWDVGSRSEYEALLEEMRVIKRKILALKSPNYSNGLLDLYIDDEAQKIGRNCENYNIALAGTGEIIGYIRVTYDDMSDNFLGNIGFKLSRQYRGNGYMLQALELLNKTMLDKGLKKPIITVEAWNKASVRTIEKFGGKKLDKDEWYDSYEVDLCEVTYRRK